MQEMSLKFFHILFIVLSVLTTVLFGLWAILADLPSGFKTMGWASLVGGILLLIYGIRFLKKAKNIII